MVRIIDVACQYCLPRVYFHQTQEYVHYADAHGVRACHAEIYPNWGKGPKPYVFLKPWWNPPADVDAPAPPTWGEAGRFKEGPAGVPRPNTVD